ncbi:HAMP domain-containing histidine kinase [Pleionea sediminis]|uniref:HAMP domain-containing histidine kinase n=1 Tax=Pleionea sediminis TaxID=2569479 RepID=UPI001184E037|nr:HAMP domain-containing histidine kinase [Pleionea sediminis]
METSISSPSYTQLQLQKLVTVRWLYIAVQLFAIIIGFVYFEYRPSLLGLIPLIIVECIFNLITQKSINRTTKASSYFIWLQLIFDLIIIALLLYFTGGATNAFVSLLLLPVTLAALLCSLKRAWVTALLAIVLYTLLMFYYQPLVMNSSHHHVENSQQMELHFWGMWITFSISTGILVYFVNLLSRNLAFQFEKINIMKEQQLRDEHLIALATQSARAVHDLSTPLNTMQLATEELRDSAVDSELLDCIENQLLSCKNTLQKIRSNHAEPAEKRVKVTKLKEQLQQQWLLQYPDFNLDVVAKAVEGRYISGDSSLLPALINFIHNASRECQSFDISSLSVIIEVVENELRIHFENPMSKTSEDIISQLGIAPLESTQGLGIGFFLANSSIERLGGKVVLFKKDSKVITNVSLPLVLNDA